MNIRHKNSREIIDVFNPVNHFKLNGMYGILCMSVSHEIFFITDEVENVTDQFEKL